MPGFCETIPRKRVPLKKVLAETIPLKTWFLWNSFSERSPCWNTIPLKKGLLGKDSGRDYCLLKRGFVEQFPRKGVSRKGFPWKRLTLKKAVSCLWGYDSTKKQTLNQVKKAVNDVLEWWNGLRGFHDIHVRMMEWCGGLNRRILEWWDGKVVISLWSDICITKRYLGIVPWNGV